MNKSFAPLPFCILLACSPWQPPQTCDCDAMLLLAEEVSASRLEGHVASLSAIPSRFMHYDEGCEQTLDYIESVLAEQGNTSCRDTFSFWRRRWIQTANLEVLFPGNNEPRVEILVGAHWDCVDWPESNNDSTTRAPGATDNATGVAALLELARIIEGQDLERSVRIVFLAAEEVGLFGSRRLAEQWHHEENGDSLFCMVNVDMIGHDRTGELDLSLICNEATASLAGEVVPLAQELTGGEVLVDSLLDAGELSSDHHWFWFYDLPAVWLHEGPGDACEAANTAAETLGLLDPPVLEGGTRSLLAIVLQMAGLIDGETTARNWDQ